MERTSTEIVKVADITAIETPADRGAVDSELAYLAPAAAAALGLLADAIKRGAADRESVVEALKEAAVHERFADVLAAASEDVMDETEDPFDFDARLDADNLSGAASQVRDLFRWL
ncbi:hypothetical protein [Streptomyces erythrochromogenes]|uniref:hypothetical protein n=1 Tax=Streptomyces erythrochromogenes TaxID=285574 RepID=UPI00224ED5D8|nr:hypothetical protein [Streptomyces erythrochromogenes]MCX5589535.1 hypothetical protein [Streptomyces erythrochromogenes]